MISLDICWASFDSSRALEVILLPQHQGRMVADVLMDQVLNIYAIF